MRLLRVLLVVGSIVILAAIGACADWTGYWGGERGVLSDSFYGSVYGNRWIYPAGFCSIEPWDRCEGLPLYAPLRWSSPLTWRFEDSTYHVWTEPEKAVAREAIREWEDVCTLLGLSIVEVGSTFDADVRIRWDAVGHFFAKDAHSGSRFEAIGFYLPDPAMFAPAYDRSNTRAFYDYMANTYGVGTDVILLNATQNGSFANTWNVAGQSDVLADYTQIEILGCDPEGARNALITLLSCADEEELRLKITSGQAPPFSVVARAPAGTSASSKYDLATVVAHEFGHVLGLQHSGGCRGCVACKPWYGKPECDDGSIMFGGDLQASLRGSNPPTEAHLVGRGEFRAVEGWRIIGILLEEYGRVAREYLEECLPCAVDEFYESLYFNLDFLDFAD